MASLTTHQSDKFIKMLLIGDSGTGKTGALASLVEAGYNLAILDFDNGLDFLANILKNKPNAATLLSRVHYVSLQDKMKQVGQTLLVDGMPKAFPTAMGLLTNWKDRDENLGAPAALGENWIVVVDSLTLMSKAAHRFAEVATSNKDGRAVYGEAQRMIENTLALLYSAQFQTHVIINSHIQFIDTENGVTKGYPSSLGKALSPTIPRYFNTVLLTQTRGSGTGAKRIITTVPSGVIDVKHSLVPGKMPSDMPIESGLATFFELALGKKPQVKAA